MTRKVVSNPMVAHLWANRAQEEARSNNGQFYFEGDTIYSYGSHFPIARWIENADGEYMVLFSGKSRSVTTARHKSLTLRAIPGGTPICVVHDIDDDYRSNLVHAQADLAQLKTQADRARTRKSDYLTQAMRTMQQWCTYAAFLGYEPPFTSDDVEEELVKAQQADVERRATETRQAQERREREEQLSREMAVKAQQRLDAWLAGEPIPTLWLPNTGPIYLRVKGDMLETSWGAECPLADAVAIFRIALRCRQTGQAFTPAQTVHAGSFRLDWVARDGTIQVGCHRLDWDEAKRLAIELGVIDAADASPWNRDTRHQGDSNCA